MQNSISLLLCSILLPKDTNWKSVDNGTCSPIYIPKVADEFDITNIGECMSIDDIKKQQSERVALHGFVFMNNQEATNSKFKDF